MMMDAVFSRLDNPLRHWLLESLRGASSWQLEDLDEDKRSELMSFANLASQMIALDLGSGFLAKLLAKAKRRGHPLDLLARTIIDGDPPNPHIVSAVLRALARVD